MGLGMHLEFGSLSLGKMESLILFDTPSNYRSTMSSSRFAATYGGDPLLSPPLPLHCLLLLDLPSYTNVVFCPLDS